MKEENRKEIQGIAQDVERNAAKAASLLIPVAQETQKRIIEGFSRAIALTRKT